MPATKSPAHCSTVTFSNSPSDFADPDSADGLEMLCAANHPAEPVEWLWPNRIAVGKVTLIAGDPGLGKSVLALDVAARVTRGSAFPDPQPPALPGACESARNARANNGRASETPIVDAPNTNFDPRQSRGLPGEHAPGSVLILSASDDLADTIRPRLNAMGADPSRVFVLPSITDLRHDFGQLKAAVDRAPNCRLIIVDPLNAFVGPSDSHFHTVVRRVLTPLMRLATEKRIAILAVTQFRKNDGAAIHRAAGSTGFVATASSLWTVCRDPRDESRNLFLPLKHNLTATARGLAFRVEEEPISGAPRIVWEPGVAIPSGAAAFAPPPKPREPSPERLAAREWLEKILATGPRPARLILEEGEQQGFLTRTLRRAFHELGGHTAKRGLLQGWWWSLDRETEPGDAEPTPNSAVLFEGVTYDEDVTRQAQFDALHGELQFGQLPAPTVSESMAALDRARPQPRSETGHPILDEILRQFRAGSSAKASPRQATSDSRSKLSPDAAPLADQVQWARRRRAADKSRHSRVACDALKNEDVRNRSAATQKPQSLEPVT